jgi:hypothetical protein
MKLGNVLNKKCRSLYGALQVLHVMLFSVHLYGLPLLFIHYDELAFVS